MEVNGLTPIPIKRFPNPMPGSHSQQAHGDEFPVLPQRNEVKIESITMDLEEMKDFLFMMIRGGAVRSESDGDTVGRIVNKFA
ncbi:MAG: hypothetical protein KBA61_10580 [Spirochaetes bacterium]|jgi:hypothetical protein|nr:hypothetical protein [Spirochaetota bacterium]HPA71108.1 hypothetical protein [Spirochaetota bacterium]